MAFDWKSRLATVCVVQAAALAACHGTPQLAGPPSAASVPPAKGILFDPGAALLREPPAVGPLPPLAVLDSGPRGRTDTAADIHVRFNQPVVPAGEQPVQAGGVQLVVEPRLPGRLLWRTPDLLVFEPKKLAPAQRYSVSLRALPGQRGPAAAVAEAQALTWTFETPGPEAEASYPAGNEQPEEWGRHQTVFVKFSQPVSIDKLRAHLRAWATSTSTKARKPMSVRIAAASRAELKRVDGARDLLNDEGLAIEAGRLFGIRPVGLWPSASEIAVEVPAGLVGRLGPVGSASDWKLTFPTPGPLAIERLRCENEGDWDGRDREIGEPEDQDRPVECNGGAFDREIGLTLTSPVAKSQLKHVQVSPRPRELAVGLVGDYDWDTGRPGSGSEVTVRGQFAAGKVYRIRLAPQMRSTNGYSVGEGTGGRALSRSFLVDGSAGLHLSAGGIFPASAPPVAGVQTRWVKSVQVRAAPIDRSQAARLVLAEKGFRMGTLGKDEKPISDWGLPPATIASRHLELSPKGPTAWSDLALDLRDLVGAVRGAIVVEVEADSVVPAQTGIQPRLPQPMRSLFWVTDLAPIVFQSPTRVVVKVVRLSDTQPVVGARIARYDRDAVTLLPLGQTDSSGLLVLERDGGEADEKLEDSPLLVVDPSGVDYTVIRLSGQRPTIRGHKKATELRANEALVLGMVTERDAYRPGEVVYVVAWAAIDTPYAQSGLRAPPTGTAAEFSIYDRSNNQVDRQTAELDANGKFWAKLRIPARTPLGHLMLEAQVMGIKKNETVKLEDFRTPEFEVTARPLRSSILAGQSTPISVLAMHYSGVPVTIDELAYVSRCQSFRYQVPNLEEGFVVGLSETWDSKILPRVLAQEATGQHGSAIFTPVLPKLNSGARRCSVDVQVQDASRQVVGAQADLVVHPASYYVALRVPSSVYAGDSVTIPVRAVDFDGRRVAGKYIKLEVTRHFRQEVQSQDGGRTRTRWEERKEIAASCALNTSAEKDRGCVLGKVKQGSYVMEATGAEGARTAQTNARFAVRVRSVPAAAKSAAKAEPPAHLSIEVQNAEGADIEHLSKQDGVKPGDRLRAIVRSPCDQSTGFLLVEKAGIRQQHALAFEAREATLDLVSDDSWTPQVFLEANVVCPAAKPGAYPTLESAQATVRQRAGHRELKVQVTAPARAHPAETIAIAVLVKDARGEPLGGSRVALWAVDEAVLSLTDYRAPNPLAWFVPFRYGETTTLHPFGSLLHPHMPDAEDPWLYGASGGGYGAGGLGMLGSGAGGGGVGTAGGSASPPARARFETTPIFLADLPVGPDGQVKTTAKLPDNLTTFRITAIASAPLEDGKSPGRFGLGEGSVQVTTPFIVRPALPRLLRPNDSAEVAAIVQNQTEWNGRLLVEASIGGTPGAPALELVGPGKVETEIPANGQMRIPFTVRALRAGIPQVELRGRLVPLPAGGNEIAQRESYVDAVRLPIPVQPESTLVERAALYGTLDSDEPIAIETGFPAARSPTVGGISVAASASLLGELQDAFTYLVGYPYGCIEQTSSQVLSSIAAQQLGKRYVLPLEEPSKQLAAGIERIASMQTSSGGFSYWPEGGEVHPYATAFATWTLLLARQSGAAVPEKVVTHALDYLETIVREPGPRPQRMASFWYGDPNLLFQSERAIALHVLAEAGRVLPAEALAAAYAERSQLSQFGRAQLLMALHRSVGANDERSRTMTDELLAGISELPATAHVREVSWYGSEQVFQSEARSDAMALLALLQTRPDHALIPKLVRGLLERRLAGKWRNTQENVHAILAVLEYARRFEAENPHFSAQAWAGGKSILNTTFGPETPVAAAGAPIGFLPMLDIPVLGKLPAVVIQRRGQGRLYYRLGTEWLPSGESLPANDRGIEVNRVLRAREAGREIAVKSGPVASGEGMAFDITVKNRTQLSYVVVNVPVPAGLEPVQEDLGRGHAASAMAEERGYWISYQEKRPDRVLLFADVLAPGSHSHTIQLRATTPGRYALPPARAEAMYAPEVYGRSEGGHLVVK